MTFNDLSSETRDFLDSGLYLDDFCQEHADGCSEVIYFAKAHALLASCSREERGRAEDDFKDCGGAETEYDTLASKLAYFVVLNRTRSLITSELDRYEAEGEDVSDEDVPDEDMPDEDVPDEDVSGDEDIPDAVPAADAAGSQPRG